MRKKRTVIETEAQIEGQTVTVKTFPGKAKRKVRNARPLSSSCPVCLSVLKLNDIKVWECTGNRLVFWEKEFSKYNTLTDEKKLEYLNKVSNTSRFYELLDRWNYCQETSELFDCGYTNEILPPMGIMQIRIPDPVFVKGIEKKLGRGLTEEELLGESELYFYAGQVLTRYRKNAKLIKIPFVLLPSEETIYL